MNEIEIFNETKEEIKELETVKKLMDYSTKVEGVENASFNIIIVDNEKIHEINKEYRGVDRPTDVISFALEEEVFPTVEGDIRMLGDIYISINKAREQAKEYGHSFEREISFLALHGFLHLLGYDHMKEEDEKVMFQRQDEILNGFGINR